MTEAQQMDKNIFDAYSVKNQNKIITVPAGMTILSEGEVNLDMYKVIEGNVEMYTGYGTDKEVLLGILSPGACFGEFGLLLHKPAIYTIITFSQVKLLRVTEGTMGDFVKENQDSIVQMMRNMAGMMLNMSHNIQQLSQELEDVSSRISPDVNIVQKKRDQDATMIKDSLREYAVKGYSYKFFGKK